VSPVAWLLRRLAARLRVRVIGDGAPHLFKYALWASGPDRTSWRLHLHRFVRDDPDPDPHDHPWSGVSLVLSGGYVEHRPGRAPRVRRPGMVNVIARDTVHRVALRGADAWTLILTGPVVRPWGFYTERGFVPWREYKARRGLAVATGEYWRARWSTERS
jgi:hypothetical protein